MSTLIAPVDSHECMNYHKVCAEIDILGNLSHTYTLKRLKVIYTTLCYEIINQQRKYLAVQLKRYTMSLQSHGSYLLNLYMDVAKQLLFYNTICHF